MSVTFITPFPIVTELFAKFIPATTPLLLDDEQLIILLLVTWSSPRIEYSVSVASRLTIEVPPVSLFTLLLSTISFEALAILNTPLPPLLPLVFTYIIPEFGYPDSLFFIVVVPSATSKYPPFTNITPWSNAYDCSAI